MKHRLVAALAVGTLVLSAGAAGAAGTGTAATGGTVLVTAEDFVAPSAPATDCAPGTVWCMVQTATPTVSIEDVPSATPTVGLRFDTPGPSDKGTVWNGEVSGTPLSALKALQYETYVAAAVRELAPVLLLEVQAGPRTATLVWEPLYSGADVEPGTWQTWDPRRADGGWWSGQNTALPSGGTALGFEQHQASYDELLESPVLAAAVIKRVGLSQGGSNAGLDAYADRLRVDGTTFDFDMSGVETVLEAQLSCTDGDAWCEVESDGGLVSGATDPRLSDSSLLRLTTPQDGSRARIWNTSLAGQPLSALETLGYRGNVLRRPAQSSLAPAAFIEVAVPGTEGPVVLAWEPVYGKGGADSVRLLEWQQWTPTEGPGWWSSRNGAGELGFTQYGASWADVVAALPDAEITRVGLAMGSGTAGFDGLVDRLRINGTTYDFEAPSLTSQVENPTSPAASPSSSPATSPAAVVSPAASPSTSPAVVVSASPSASPTPSASSGSSSSTGSGSGTSTGSGSGSGSSSGGSSAVGSASSPSPSAAPSESSSASSPEPSAAPAACRPAAVVLDRRTITATGSAEASWSAAPGSTALLYAYSQPSKTYQVVRRVAVGDSGTARTQLRPATNTRLYALQEGCDDSFASDSVVLNVRTQISLDVVRTGTRSYTFSGRLLPARPGGLIASLYRVTSDGQQVLTAQTRAGASDGRYTMSRKFSGGGRFSFVVRTGQDLQNAPGSSNVRSLLVF